MPITEDPRPTCQFGPGPSPPLHPAGPRSRLGPLKICHRPPGEGAGGLCPLLAGVRRVGTGRSVHLIVALFSSFEFLHFSWYPGGSSRRRARCFPRCFPGVFRPLGVFVVCCVVCSLPLRLAWFPPLLVSSSQRLRHQLSSYIIRVHHTAVVRKNAV